MYYFPRDCPRACFWPGLKTSTEDRGRWFGGIDARIVIAGVRLARPNPLDPALQLRPA